MLASNFARNACVLRSPTPLDDDQIRGVAPSIFAADKHESRSDRYTYIPTIEVLNALRDDGFQPFMVCQTRVRVDAKRDFTKHMLRLRKSGQIARAEADEIVLLNSHDGTSSYQIIGGLFRYVCQNGLVFGETTHDVRVPHKGDVVENVVRGAKDVIEGFDLIRERKEGMQAVTLDEQEQLHLARAALALRYDTTIAPAPVTEAQLIRPRRVEDQGSDLWRTFNRIQESMTQGGLRGRTKTGKRMTTRAVAGIDQTVGLNRALWVLAEAMRQHKA